MSDIQIERPEPSLDVVVSVDDQHLDKLPQVADTLRDAGLDISSSLESLGIITGSAKPSSLPQLRNIQGVSGVETSHSYQVPPPDSKVF